MKKPDTLTPPRRIKSYDSAPFITATSASPHHRRALSAIPFSWEQHPGIAKPTIQTKVGTSDIYFAKPRLPRPPPMSLSHSPIRPPKKRNSTAVMITDPFELALAECAKAPPTPPGLMEEIWGRKMVEPQRTRWRFRLGVQYGRCNAASACSTIDSKVHVPRAGIQTATCRLLSQGRFMWYVDLVCVLLLQRNYFLHQKSIACNMQNWSFSFPK